MTGETKRQSYERLISDLRLERASYIPHWTELNDYFLPRVGRFLVTDSKARGDKRNQKIINNTGTMSARTLQAGMMGGVTSPAKPWFKLATGDPALDEFGSVKEWLHVVAYRMREVFRRSNVYNALPHAYADLGVFGTHAMAVLEDDETVIRCYAYPIGSYAVANNSRLIVDTCVREWTMTVRQLVNTFGLENCSDTVKRLYENQSYQDSIEVAHIVQPNADYKEGSPFSKNKKFSSCYMERGMASTDLGDKFLRMSGFEDFPILAPRWSLTGEDIYGNSPGMEALGDCKALQLKEKRKAQLIDKGTSPPMAAPSSLRNERSSLLAGDVTYYDTNAGQVRFEPVYQPAPQWLGMLVEDIRMDEQRVKRAFFEDLFLMLSAMDTGSPVTATEIAERKEEKLLVLGPVLERLNDELLDPLIDRTFNIMLRRGMIPEPPPELRDVDLKVEYVSVMAQALKMVGIGGIERFSGYVGNLAAVNPEILDKYDMDASVDEYGSLVGVPPRLIVPDDKVAEIRAARKQQQAAAMAAEQGAALAQGAQTLSQTDVAGDNALTRILQNMQSAQGVV